jgi:MFS family permease
MILRNRSLLALLVAEVISGVGSRMTYLALPWFVLVTTHSPSKMGIVLAVEVLPVGLLGIPSGSIVSRLGARTTMLISDIVRVPLMASLPILHAAGMLSFPLLLVLVFTFGCFWAPYFAAQRSILPELLGDDEQTITQANSVIEGATHTTGLLGPPIAGVLIASLGAANVIYVDAATFLFSFIVMLTLVPGRRRKADADAGGGVFAGVQFFFRDRLLGPLAGVIVVWNALGQMLVASLPVLAFERYGDPKVGGWLFAAFGLGGVLGTIVAFRLVARVEPLKLASIAALGMGLPFWVLPLHVSLAFILGAIAATAFAGPSVNSPFFGALTARTPPALLPKVMAALITLATIAGPVGLLTAGWLLQHYGLRTTFVVIAVGHTTAAVTFSALILRYRRAQPGQAGEPFATAIVSDSVP